MATLYTQKDSNVRKTWLLMTVFLVLIIAVGWLISLYFDSPGILYFAIILSLFMNILAYWQSDKIALSMAGAKLIEHDQNQYLYHIVENLCITAGLPVPKIYLIPSNQINAFATGRNPEHAAIAVTSGALAKLKNEELEGVLAHELSHVGNRDILISTVAVVLAGVLSLIANWFFRISMFGGRGDRDREGGGLLQIVAIVAVILAPIAATLVQLAISRKREYLADASGALLTRYPDGLANALEKIEIDNSPMIQANTATSHLYINDPFKGKQKESWFAKLFMTHPPITERIKILRGMQV
jgi:heat shock protein HtpX